MLPIDIEIPAALGLLEGGGQKKLREQDLFPEEPFFLGAASNKKEREGIPIMIRLSTTETVGIPPTRESLERSGEKKVEPRPAAALIKPEMRAPFLRSYGENDGFKKQTK